MMTHSEILAPTLRGRRFSRGVTLIELMTVVAILAIVASIAIPSYRRYLIRSQRSEAKIALLQFQTAEEKFYMQNNAFTDKIGTAPPAGLGVLTTTETGKYAITVAVTGGVTYIATAAPAAGGGQADDKECGSFTITEKGVKGISGGTKDAQYCWR
jgi:type IV pilus assembly protein PilE